MESVAKRGGEVRERERRGGWIKNRRENFAKKEKKKKKKRKKKKNARKIQNTRKRKQK